MEKNYIFYSNYCHHSNKLLNLLKNNNMINNFELCCVDDSQIQLPSFITCVPTLYIVSQKRTLNDDALFHFLNIEINKSSQPQQLSQPQPPPQQFSPQQFSPQQMSPQQMSPQQMSPQQMTPQQMSPQQMSPQQLQSQQPQQQQNQDEVNAYFVNEMGSNFSDQYSFIDESQQNIKHSYSFLDNSNDNNNNNNNNNNNSNSNNNYNSNNNFKRTEKTQLMDQAYEQLMAQRSQDSPQHIGALRI